MYNFSKYVALNPQAEVQDTNDYYDCLYEEGTSGTRDNNSTYGDTWKGCALQKCSLLFHILFICTIAYIHILRQFNNFLAFSFWVHFPKTAKLHLTIPRLFILFILGIFVNFWTNNIQPKIAVARSWRHCVVKLSSCLLCQTYFSK